MNIIYNSKYSPKEEDGLICTIYLGGEFDNYSYYIVEFEFYYKGVIVTEGFKMISKEFFSLTISEDKEKEITNIALVNSIGPKDICFAKYGDRVVLSEIHLSYEITELLKDHKDSDFPEFHQTFNGFINIREIYKVNPIIERDVFMINKYGSRWKMSKKDIIKQKIKNWMNIWKGR